MKHFIFLFLFFVSFVAFSQPPAGYYNAANGLTGEDLRIALHNIISNGSVVLSYNNLPDYYETTDVKPNGKVWDMYSDIPGGTPPYEFSFGMNCGSYGGESDCYNREHSVPASWFNDNSPMYSDIYHIVPTDGYVNGRRSNYPFGEVGSTTWTSQNGSKLGSNTFAGYSGTVFEPIDSFKGDFARIYFYMATRYKDEISSWSSVMFSGNNLTTYGKNLMYAWHQLDPVSTKERNRNNTAYVYQHNRNPYVDNPTWVDNIWGPSSGIYDNFINTVTVYPIPAESEIYFSGLPDGGQYKINFYDVTGKLLYVVSDYETGKPVSIVSLKKGVYVINIASESAMFVTRIVL